MSVDHIRQICGSSCSPYRNRFIYLKNELASSYGELICPCFCFGIFFVILFIIFALLVLLHLSPNSDPGSHSTLFSPLHITAIALNFYREKDSELSPLVDSRRIVPTHATIGALNSWCHSRIKKSTRRFEPKTSLGFPRRKPQACDALYNPDAK